jgi:hypothetical protein
VIGHRLDVERGDGVLVLVCSCGWRDAPWSTVGLPEGGQAKIDLWVREAGERHIAEVRQGAR